MKKHQKIPTQHTKKKYMYQNKPHKYKNTVTHQEKPQYKKKENTE